MIIPSVNYPANIDNSDPVGYPQGKAQNDSGPMATDGTPLDFAWLNDWLGFQQAAMAAAGEVPSGVSDKAGASQLLDALLKLNKTTWTLVSNAPFDSVIPNNLAPWVEMSGRVPLEGDTWYFVETFLQATNIRDGLGQVQIAFTDIVEGFNHSDFVDIDENLNKPNMRRVDNLQPRMLYVPTAEDASVTTGTLVGRTSFKTVASPSVSTFDFLAGSDAGATAITQFSAGAIIKITKADPTP